MPLVPTDAFLSKHRREHGPCCPFPRAEEPWCLWHSGSPSLHTIEESYGQPCATSPWFVMQERYSSLTDLHKSGSQLFTASNCLHCCLCIFTGGGDLTGEVGIAVTPSWFGKRWIRSDLAVPTDLICVTAYYEYNVSANVRSCLATATSLVSSSCYAASAPSCRGYGCSDSARAVATQRDEDASQQPHR